MKYDIKPLDINAKKHFWNAFGQNEKEISAGWIVRLMQQDNKWNPFTKKDIERFYNQSGFRNFWFNGLDDGQHIIEKDGIYEVTPLFVAKCYQSSPEIL
jgi:hypothetical protein